MKTEYLSAPIEILKGSAVAVGSFDGLHLGHRVVLERLKQVAAEKGLPSVVFTFSPHPRVFFNRSGFKVLTTSSEKVDLLCQMGIDIAVVAGFDADLAMLTAEDFVLKYLIGSLGMKSLVVGTDHALGKDRRGDISGLREIAQRMGFEVYEVEPMASAEGTIRSTKIRQLLFEGEVTRARALLGRAYCICGEVISGDGRGKKLGFPTLNIKTPDEKLIPKAGVYSAVDSEGIFGLLYIGSAPTFRRGEQSVEFHGLNRPGVRFGDEFCVSLLGRIRDEKTFPDGFALIEQMNKDKLALSRGIENNLFKK